MRGGVAGVTQLAPDVDLPEEAAAHQEVAVRVGEVPAPWREELILRGPQRRVEAVPVERRFPAQAEEGQVRTAPGENLIAGDLNLLIQNLQFLVAGDRLGDCRRQDRVVEELLDADPGRIVRGRHAVEVRRQGRASLRGTELRQEPVVRAGGNPAAPQNEHHGAGANAGDDVVLRRCAR